MALDKVIIHIGKHKTGSTAFQFFLRKTRHQLESKGFFALPHRYGGRLAAVAIRDQMPIPPVIDVPQIEAITPEVVREEIRAQLEGKEVKTLLVTSEHLSYFRSSEEVLKMKACLPMADEYEVYVVTRDPEEFRRSFLKQVASTGHGPSDDPKSPYYLKKDSWLLDDEGLVQCWQKEFEKVVVIDYSPEGMVKKLGSAMNLPAELLTREYRANRSWSKLKSLSMKVRKVIRVFPGGKILLTTVRRWKWG